MADNNDPKKKKDGAKLPDELAEATGVHMDTADAGMPHNVNIRDWPEAPLRVTPAAPVEVNVKSGSLDVTLNGTPVNRTDVQAFWEYLRQRTDAIAFDKYEAYISNVFCFGEKTEPDVQDALVRLRTSRRASGIDAYQLLRVATEAFLLVNCGSIVDFKPEEKPFRLGDIGQSTSRFGRATTMEELEGDLAKYLGDTPGGRLPYFQQIIGGFDVGDTTTPFFCGDLDAKVLEPCFIELLWSYWQEEEGIVQAINAISLRFQNKRAAGDHDPLANLDLHPLRPLANFFFGYVQDEDHRLTVARRAYEYEYEYGLSLIGKAVRRVQPADRRSKFLTAFHSLLHQAAIFYDRSAQLTVRADAFPLFNALREVHLILAEGAHNQFRNLPWMARVEMLIQQWLLSRREVREFLGGRPAVPYPENWMSAVEVIRRVMGWGDTSVTHFNDLAITGEKIVLSVRYANWTDRKMTDDDASGWATYWKPEIQRYIHAYQAVTGVDLSATNQVTSRQIDDTMPSALIQQRIARQRR